MPFRLMVYAEKFLSLYNGHFFVEKQVVGKQNFRERKLSLYNGHFWGCSTTHKNFNKKCALGFL